MESRHEKRKDFRKCKCFIPDCPNTRVKNPEKVFVHVHRALQRKWCEQVKIPYKRTQNLYCCEDHLTLEEDLENYYRWKWTGCSARLKNTAILQYNQENEPLPSSFGETTRPLPPPPPSPPPLPPCSSCLSYGRDLQPLGDLIDIYWTLVHGEDNLCEVLVCWECRGALRRCASFQQQAARARDVLTLTRTGKLAQITDNSLSLSKLKKTEEPIVISINSEGKDEDITAINVKTEVLEVKHEPYQHEETFNVMILNPPTTSKKRKMDRNKKVKDAMSVEIQVPALNLEEQEPLCEIEEIKMELEDPLENDWKDNDLNASTEDIKTAPQEITENKNGRQKKYDRRKNCSEYTTNTSFSLVRL